MLCLGSHLLEVRCSTQIAKNITGGGKKQEAQAGVDYIKVNFHTDNFAFVDKIIDVLAPLSDVDHILRDELHGLRSDKYTTSPRRKIG